MTVPLRSDLQLIAEQVPANSRVLDLGCQGGELLQHLAAVHGCHGTGVEIDPDAVLRAVAAGVPVLERDITEQVHHFTDDSYDVAVLSRTLQVIRRPGDVLAQMARIAPTLIVSVPNFGYWRHRATLLSGRMPMSREIPHRWYETPNIHHTTLVTLEELFHDLSLRVVRRTFLDERGRRRHWSLRVANALAGSAVYVLGSRPSAHHE